MERESPLPDTNLGLVFTPQICFEHDKKGVAWLALGEFGLYKLVYDFENDSFSSTRVTPEGCPVYAGGIGMENFGSPFHTLYASAVLKGEYALWRSCNEGGSWEKLNGKDTMFGRINSISGDKRVFGRFFFGTAHFGLMCGEEHLIEKT